MKKRIAIYGGTELSAAESWFVVSLTHALLTHIDVIIVTGGFLYWPKKRPGEISTDFSVLQGAIRYAAETGVDLKDCLETWPPDPDVEDDPEKKDVVRFKEGNVKDLTGESAQARRFSMVRDVDLIITIKGKKHTSVVLDFALTINKPAFSLPFTGGDSLLFWKDHKDRVKEWFELTDEFADELEVESVELWTPPIKSAMISRIVAAVEKGLEKEALNEEQYKTLQNKYKNKREVRYGQDSVFESFINDKKLLNSEGTASKSQLNIFLSYAHEDEALKNELDKHLTPLKRSGEISVWHDKKLLAGSNRDETIREELEQADMILLLISPDFVASDNIWNTELEYALKKHKEDKAKVIPIFLRSVYIRGLPFETIKGYISSDKPVASFRDFERDEAFFEVVVGISNDIDKYLRK